MSSAASSTAPPPGFFASSAAGVVDGDSFPAGWCGDLEELLGIGGGQQQRHDATGMSSVAFSTAAPVVDGGDSFLAGWCVVEEELQGIGGGQQLVRAPPPMVWDDTHNGGPAMFDAALLPVFDVIPCFHEWVDMPYHDDGGGGFPVL